VVRRNGDEPNELVIRTWKAYYEQKQLHNRRWKLSGRKQSLTLEQRRDLMKECSSNMQHSGRCPDIRQGEAAALRVRGSAKKWIIIRGLRQWANQQLNTRLLSVWFVTLGSLRMFSSSIPWPQLVRDLLITRRLVHEILWCEGFLCKTLS
jgi:hypothetical protein